MGAPVRRLAASLTLLCACGGDPAMPVARPEASCVGKAVVPAGLEEIKDDGLLQRAGGQPGKGGICGGRVFRVENAMTVYRVWERSKPDSKLGRWWSFDKPAMTLEQFRAAYDVCAEWGQRDVLAQCHLVAGAEVVIGVGQSVDCKEERRTLPGSPTLQLFVPSDARDAEHPTLFVTDCGADQPWP